MEGFRLELGLREALGLFLVLESRGEDERAAALLASLRAFLYESLSIADMEEPELLYERLSGRAPGLRSAGATRGDRPAEGGRLR